MTVTVDNGGPIGHHRPTTGPSADSSTRRIRRTRPIPECADPTVCTETADYRTDLGPVLTAGFQGFIGQTNAFQWGKRHYADGENGGISGIVFYAITRAEDDPEMAAGEPWEPGIPGVTVNLYAAIPTARPCSIPPRPTAGTTRSRPAASTATASPARSSSTRMVRARSLRPHRLLRRPAQLQPGAAGGLRRRLRIWPPGRLPGNEIDGCLPRLGHSIRH